MMKYIIIVSAMSIVFSALQADPTLNETLGNKEAESFFYNKGLQDGIERGKKIGAKEAYAKAEKSLAKYARRIKANEVGKYLYKNQKITPPRLYQTQDENGRISVVIDGCKLEKQLSPEEILSLPVYDDGIPNNEGYSSKNSNTSKDPVSDNVFLAGLDDDSSRASLSGAEAEIVYRNYKDTEFNRNLFRMSGKPYSIVSDGVLKVIFDSKEDVRRFNLRYKVSNF